MSHKTSLPLASVLGLSLGLSLLPGAQAQTFPGTATVKARTAAVAPYRLGADDVISIQVINFPELTAAQVTVPPDGKISVQLVDSLPITGMTTTELAQVLTQRWSAYVVKPSVTVTLAQKRKESVLLYGHVGHAQTVEYKPDLHLTEALALAGGGAEDGDLSKVTLTHKDGDKQTLDLSDPSTADWNLPLAPNDVVYVPENHDEFSVLGEVAKPGSYHYKSHTTVLEALNAAGNVAVASANLGAAKLLHDGKEMPLDLEAILNKGDLAGNITLSPGDRIFIPELNNRVYVGGAVARLGYYNFKYGDRLLDALNNSGTVMNASDLAKVQLIHQDKLKNTVIAQTVDFQRFYDKGDTKVNLQLAPDDVIYVPMKGHKMSFGEILGNLTGVGAVAGTARVLGLMP